MQTVSTVYVVRYANVNIRNHVDLRRTSYKRYGDRMNESETDVGTFDRDVL